MNRPKRFAGSDEIASIVARLNNQVAMNDSHQNAQKVLIIPSYAMSTALKRMYVLDNINLGYTEIFRLTTPLGIRFSSEEMYKLMDLLKKSNVWGINMGEFHATDEAWCVFGNQLKDTLIGFAWINESGKDIGASTHTHQWLLGIGPFRQNGVLRGPDSPLSVNRLKVPHSTSIRPWYDSKNPTLKSPLSRKFLFNPHNSRFFFQ